MEQETVVTREIAMIEARRTVRQQAERDLICEGLRITGLSTGDGSDSADNNMIRVSIGPSLFEGEYDVRLELANNRCGMSNQLLLWNVLEHAVAIVQTMH